MEYEVTLWNESEQQEEISGEKFRIYSLFLDNIDFFKYSQKIVLIYAIHLCMKVAF